MIVRTLDDCRQGRRHVVSAGWESTRLLLADDKLGFSFHITTIHAGASLTMHYKHHIELVYCISGEGEIVDLSEGTIHPISPGIMYALDRHDRHVLRARTGMQMACVFNPPVTGRETHRADGSYAPADEVSCDANN